MGKLLQALHTTHFKTPSATAQTILEHQLRMKEEECARQRGEKAGIQREMWERDTGEERERRETLIKLKTLEVQLQETQDKYTEADR
jgi:hypothetical protein